MIKTGVLGAALLAIALSQAACKTAGNQAAAPSAKPVTTQVAAAEDDEDPIICKRQSDSSSRVKKTKVCKTKSAWRNEEYDTQKSMRDFDRRSGTQGREL